MMTLSWWKGTTPRQDIRSEMFYTAYLAGEEAEDDRWVLDFGEWASVYRTWLARQTEKSPEAQASG